MTRQDSPAKRSDCKSFLPWMCRRVPGSLSHYSFVPQPLKYSRVYWCLHEDEAGGGEIKKVQ
jgi:hypothetical protein